MAVKGVFKVYKAYLKKVMTLNKLFMSGCSSFKIVTQSLYNVHFIVSLA